MVRHDSHHRFGTNKITICCEVHGLQKWGASGDLPRVPSRAGEQNGQIKPNAPRSEHDLLIPQQRL
jgi:hypothetical protein